MTAIKVEKILKKEEIQKIIHNHIHDCSMKELLRLFEIIREEFNDRMIIEQEGWSKTWNIKEEKE